MVGAHRARHVGDARGLERPRIPRRDRLAVDRRHAGVTGLRAGRVRAVADRVGDLATGGDLRDQLLHRDVVTPLHAAGVHQDSDRRAGLDRVEADLVAESVERRDLVPGVDGAVGAEQGQRLELEGARLVVAVGVVDDVRAGDDAAGHAVVHAAAALLEARDDAGSREGRGVGALSLDAVLVGEGVEHLRHVDARARAVLHRLGAIEVGLRHALAELHEGLLVLAVADAGLARVDGHVLETLAPHDGAEAAAGRVARRTPDLVLVGAADGSAAHLPLAGRADRDEGGVGRVALREMIDQRVVPHPLAVGDLLDRHAVRRHVEGVPRFRVRGLARHDDHAVAELHHVLGRVAAGVRFLDAAGEGALAAYAHAARGRGGRSGQDAGGEDEDVVRPERVALGIAFLDEDPCGERAAAQVLPLLREVLDGGRQSGHVEAYHLIAHGGSFVRGTGDVDVKGRAFRHRRSTRGGRRGARGEPESWKSPGDSSIAVSTRFAPRISLSWSGGVDRRAPSIG